MSHLDRLSALISRFTISVHPVSRSDANLVVFKTIAKDMLTRAVLAPGGLVAVSDHNGEVAAFCGRAQWGGDGNPLLNSLSAQVELDIESDPKLAGLLQLLVAESVTPRCGSAAVINRLGEILLVQMLREQINRGTTTPGLLGGLADRRLSRAIVAMHDSPGKPWTNEKLAAIAGLSMSHFYQLFKQLVGMTPIAYLRSWRMTLARQDIEKGDRIQAVARRYCYNSAEALTRSFTKTFGRNPLIFRKRARGIG